ncbi:hypothetical protein PLICRDRAFT_222641 [Plicaturopsis crispa FD-325 SS-3]|nr:hypothetical protein PLICRDRAFT_222641 [Plicaturopsis crispa FD-325 SS-3]
MSQCFQKFGVDNGIWASRSSDLVVYGRNSVYFISTNHYTVFPYTEPSTCDP